MHFDAKDDDAGSGVDEAKTTPNMTVDTETAFDGLDIIGEAFDRASNKGTDKVTVKLDKTAPTIQGKATGPLGQNDWYTGPVTVHFTCSDALSGAVCPKDQVINSNGAAQKATGIATDAADNSAAPPFPPRLRGRGRVGLPGISR